jgi:hypothetical protein
MDDAYIPPLLSVVVRWYQAKGRYAWCQGCDVVFRDDLPPLAGVSYACPMCGMALWSKLSWEEIQERRRR